MIVRLIAAGSLTLAGLAVVAPAASAEPAGRVSSAATSADGDVQAQYAGQFDVYNMTDQVLTVEQAWTNQTTWDGIAPVAGQKIYPGQKLHFAVHAKGTSGTDAGWVYMRVGNSKSYVVAVAKPSFSVGFRDSRVDYEPWRESSLDFGESAFKVTPESYSTLLVTNTKARSYTLASDKAEAQLETLREICANDSKAVCSFRPTSYTSALAAPKRVGIVLRNSGFTTVNQSYTWRSTTTTSSQWGVEAGLSTNVLNLVQTTFSSHYQETVTETSDVGETTTVPVNPGHSSWLTYEAPVFRTTGDFTAKVGGNTWNITGVTFDVPKPDKDKLGTLDVHQLPNGDPGIPTATVQTVS